MRPLSAFLALGLLTLVPAASRAADFEFKDGDRVVFVGNTLIEREQRYGYWETVLTALHPDKNITFRNLGWSGDTVWGEAQARFGGPAEGFKHLKDHVAALKPTVIIAGYGLNESFAGPAGLPRFEQGLSTLLDMLEATKARIVVLGPPRQEDLGRPLPDPTANNKNIRLYADALKKAADKRGHKFVDLYEALGQEKQPLTDNGIHFTGYGYWKSAPILAWGLCGRVPLQRVDWDGDAGADGLHFELQLDILPPPPAPGQPSEFRQVLRLAGLGTGSYGLHCKAGPMQSVTGTDCAKGVSLSSGAEIAQVEQLRATIIDKNQTYFHRWRPANETYLFGFRKNEQGQNAKEIPEFDPLVEKLEEKIAELRVPKKHKYELRQEK